MSYPQTAAKRHSMQHQYQIVLQHPWRFIIQVFRGFRASQGLLLAGAVAYYALLSIIPLITLILLILSQFIDHHQLLETLQQNIAVVLPAHAEVITQQMAMLLENRGFISWLMVAVLLFFSSMAFTVVENAMSFIFFHRVDIHRRHFLVSAILPYAYILVLGVGFLLMSLIAGALYAIEGTQVNLFGIEFTLESISRITLYLIGLAGQILILTSFYLVMPLGKLSFRHALIGGITAGLLWEIVRHALVWYFSTLSVVSIVYGSLATAIVFLLSLEVAGLILLFGAQVIAEFERFKPDMEAVEGIRD
ncbi:MAG: YihY/virulence factor BrkB family protein [Gammaproteobacteria bacterium]